MKADLTINHDGSIILSKPIHGNLMNVFKIRYYGYSKTEAREKFKKSFAKEEEKYFINKVK